MNPFFLVSVALVIAGTIMTSEGTARMGLILLAVGIPLLVISAVLSLGGKI